MEDLSQDGSSDVPYRESYPTGQSSGSSDLMLALQASGERGANWFFWIAGLSLVNSVVLLTGGDWHFVVGLGVTTIVDAMAAEMAEENTNIAGVLKGVAFGIDAVVALVLILFGWLCRKRFLSVFALGMALYLLDGLLYVLIQDWLSVAFHAFVLSCMWSGFAAYFRLRRVEQEAQLQAAGFGSP